MDCIFCKIVAGQIPAPIVIQDETAIAIADLHPQAKKHFLVIPRRHLQSLETAFQEGEAGLVEVRNLYALAAKLVVKEGLLPDGFRAVINTNAYGGQSVDHLHLHILGGENLRGNFGK